MSFISMLVPTRMLGAYSTIRLNHSIMRLWLQKFTLLSLVEPSRNRTFQAAVPIFGWKAGVVTGKEHKPGLVRMVIQFEIRDSVLNQGSK